MSKIPTPRTDAARKWMVRPDDREWPEVAVDLEHAKTLERELAVALKAISLICEYTGGPCEEYWTAWATNKAKAILELEEPKR